ncbi:MAG TPA: ABC transporter permease [Vicinamibacterales bacterium]|nr:ABC transporter permease [Vicinamibacterales bacterium]
MRVLTLVRVSLKALQRNKMRTALTMLGVIIGVSAVICTIAIGEGASGKIRDAIASIGANVVWVEAGGVNRNGVRTGSGGTKSLTLADMQAIRDQIALIAHASPMVDTRTQLVYGNQNWNSTVRGVSPDYLNVKVWPVVKGAMFGEQDVEHAAPVCVLGQTIVDQLFADQDPIGETVRVMGEPCKVVGVLGVKGQSATGQDQDDTFFMPYTTVMKKIKGQYWLDDIMMSAVSGEAIPAAEEQIDELLRRRHRIREGMPEDFNLRHPTEIAEAVAASARTMEMLLAAVASVSLFVGGVGIMNIMLVSVTERTREIGLRLAVGARGRDVLRQFLLEAVILSLAGGVIGIALGIGGTRTISGVFEWPTRVSPDAIGMAVAFAAAIGIFFGYYPARRAARLDPIDALRHE